MRRRPFGAPRSAFVRSITGISMSAVRSSTARRSRRSTSVPGGAGNLRGLYPRAEAAIRKILAAGAIPITIGGDHGVPIPIFRAFSDHGPITLIHYDAHLDWRDHVNGAREGYSSPIRRAGEMPHIKDIFQIGLRGQGSPRPEEVAAALRRGAHLITASDLHRAGVEAILQRIPAGGRPHL